MKFSHSLQFNAVPEWSSKYIAYNTLKKLIYSLQRELLSVSNEQDLEEGRLLILDTVDRKKSTDVFIAALDAELHKIDSFYRKQESHLSRSIDELLDDIESFGKEVDDVGASENGEIYPGNSHSVNERDDLSRRESSDGSLAPYEPYDDSDQEEDGAYRDDPNEDVLSNRAKQSSLHSKKSVDAYFKNLRMPEVWNSINFSTTTLPPRLMFLAENRILLRKRIIGLFTMCSELKSFIELNFTGFKKALKKFDKSLNTSIKDNYLEQLPKNSYVFEPETMKKIEEQIEKVIKLYALVCTKDNDYATAKSELSVYLREHVIWERNTVWRDMIGIERKSHAANSKIADRRGSTQALEGVATGFNFSLYNPTILKLGLVVFITVLLLFVSPFSDLQQKNCFALLICCSLLWAMEVIPLFVTSLAIPFLIVFLGVLKNDDGTVMPPVKASNYILSTMWNSVILLLLGGFTLAAALSKYHIAKLVSTWILSRAGTQPSTVLLTIMSVALFASMWVSNVAAPVLCFSLIQPILRTLPKGSQFSKALILGIALASNVGGMASPIASPQNMIAIGSMDPYPSWGQWFVVSLPVCILSLLGVWIFLLLSFNCNSKDTQIVPIRQMKDKFTIVQWYVTIVSLFTILLWCFGSKLEKYVGEMGIIALVPLVLFFGPGFLTTEDFNNYPWNIAVLAMGGTALGKAVASSGLLSTIAITIQHQVQFFSLFSITLIFGLLILTVATFISHTVAALIIIPIVEEIGSALPEPHPRLLVMASALLCSAAMGLPTSGFPNVTAICMTDEFGKPYLTVGTFIKRGLPASVITYFIIVTVGFLVMKVIKF